MDESSLLSAIDAIDEQTKGQLQARMRELSRQYQDAPHRWRDGISGVFKEYEHYACLLLSETITEIKKQIEYARKFDEGRRKPRRHYKSLAVILESILCDYKEVKGVYPPWRTVVKELKKAQYKHAIDDVEDDEEKIFLVGRPKPLTFNYLRTLLTDARKKVDEAI